MKNKNNSILKITKDMSRQFIEELEVVDKDFKDSLGLGT